MSNILGLEKTEEKIKIHFEGEKGIEIETLIASLEYARTTFKSAKNNIYGINDYEIIVEPFKEGSFIIDIRLLVYVISELLPSVVSMGKVFLDTLKIWKTLKGKPAQKVTRNLTNNTVEIIGDNNSVIVISPESLNTVIETQKIAEDISNVAKKMMKGNTKRGAINCFAEKDGEKETITLDTNDLNNIRNTVYVKESLTKEVIHINNVILKPNIVNLDIIDDWKFTSSLSDRPFKAKIEDSEFKRKVEEGLISFSTETRIKVVLQTTEKLIEDGTGKKNYTHSIIKVEEVIDGVNIEQLKVDFEEK